MVALVCVVGAHSTSLQTARLTASLILLRGEHSSFCDTVLLGTDVSVVWYFLHLHGRKCSTFLYACNRLIDHRVHKKMLFPVLFYAVQICMWSTVCYMMCSVLKKILMFVGHVMVCESHNEIFISCQSTSVLIFLSTWTSLLRRCTLPNGNEKQPDT